MKRDIIAGSDHVALILQLKWTGSCNSVKYLDDECVIRIPRVTDYKDFQLKLDELLEALDWGNLDLEQQRQALQETLVDVGKRHMVMHLEKVTIKQGKRSLGVRENRNTI